MRTLVTGHNGYLGAVMTASLVARGHDVVGLDTYYFGDCTHGPETEDVPSLALDVRDVEASHLRGFDAVVHLAALSNDPLGDLAPEQTYDINLHASIRLAKLARDAGVSRFLFSSSCSIYGAAGGDDLVNESAPMRPVTPYAESKVRVEDALHELADDRFSPVYMRNATAYGWSPRLRADLVVNNLVASALLTGEAKVLSDGTPWRPLIHAADIAHAFVAALEAPRETVHDEAFNVGADRENYQVRDVAEIVGQVVPDCRVVVTGETGADPRSYRVDFSKIRHHLPAFVPAWNVRRGAEELYGRFREYGLTSAQIEQRFTRLRWLSTLRESGRLGDDLRWSSDTTSLAAAGGAR